MSSGMRFNVDQLNPRMREQVERKLAIAVANSQPRPVAPMGKEPPEPKPAKRSKFFSAPDTRDGKIFHSKKEARRWDTLSALEGLGKISKLRTQVKFDLVVNGVDLCDYVADFVYEEVGKTIVEDVKGFRQGTAYALFKLKAGLMKALYGVEVRES